METKTYLKILIVGTFFFCCASINIFAQPQFIWEKIYKCEDSTTAPTASIFEFSDKHSDRINLFQSVPKTSFFIGTQPLQDTMLFYGTQIDMETGNLVGDMNFIKYPTRFTIYNHNIIYSNDSVYVFLERSAYYDTTVSTRRGYPQLIKLDFNREGNRFIPHYPDTDIYWDTTTTIKGRVASNFKYDNVYDDSFYVEDFYYKYITKVKYNMQPDSIYLDTLYVTEDIGSEFSNFGISSININRIDANTNCVKIGLTNSNFSVLNQAGIFFGIYNTSGKILSQNIFRESIGMVDYQNSGLFNGNYYNIGRNISPNDDGVYMVDSGFARLFDNEGNLLYKHNAYLRYELTPILYDYAMSNLFPSPLEVGFLSIRNFDESEVVAYNYGRFRINLNPNPHYISIHYNELNASNFYFSKRTGRDDELVVDYEYAWRKVIDGDTLGTCHIFKALYRDGYVYLFGVVDRVGYYCNLLEWVKDSTTLNPGKLYLYVAKFEEPETSITEFPTITNTLVSPNPADETTTLSLELDVAGKLTITLIDLLGAELFELHNAFTDAGPFTKTFSIEKLPVGVYYLKIIHNGNTKVEKVIKN